jgi:hypothetical protein
MKRKTFPLRAAMNRVAALSKRNRVNYYYGRSGGGSSPYRADEGAEVIAWKVN